MKNHVKGFTQFVNESARGKHSLRNELVGGKRQKEQYDALSKEEKMELEDLFAKLNSGEHSKVNKFIVGLSKYDSIGEIKSALRKAVKSLDESIDMDYDEYDEFEPDEHTAVVSLSSMPHGGFATLSFRGETTPVKEKRSLQKTWQNILDVAHVMGAKRVYSEEDGEFITQADVDQLDDSPSDWY